MPLPFLLGGVLVFVLSLVALRVDIKGGYATGFSEEAPSFHPSVHRQGGQVCTRREVPMRVLQAFFPSTESHGGTGY